jgi:hypothetical protein
MADISTAIPNGRHPVERTSLRFQNEVLVWFATGDSRRPARHGEGARQGAV